MPGALTRFGKSIMLDRREIAQARDEDTAASIVEDLRFASRATRYQLVNAIIAGLVGTGLGIGLAAWGRVICG